MGVRQGKTSVGGRGEEKKMTAEQGRAGQRTGEDRIGKERKEDESRDQLSFLDATEARLDRRTDRHTQKWI